jgi:hypothetical protein
MKKSESHEVEIVKETQPDAIEGISRGELAVRIEKALANPRAASAAMAELEAVVTASEDTANECFYVLPRAGKDISGPSVRFAEALSYCWRNNMVGARSMGEDDRMTRSAGYYTDFERNTCVMFEVGRRIVDKAGRRFGDDMIQITQNAASAIALRNSILRGIPQLYWKPALKAAQDLLIGKGKSMEEKRDGVSKFFSNFNITDDRIARRMGRTSIIDLTDEDIVTLRGLANALKDGATSIQEVFPAEGGATVANQRLSEEAPKPRIEEPPPVVQEAPPPAVPETDPTATRTIPEDWPAGCPVVMVGDVVVYEWEGTAARGVVEDVLLPPENVLKVRNDNSNRLNTLYLNPKRTSRPWAVESISETETPRDPEEDDGGLGPTSIQNIDEVTPPQESEPLPEPTESEGSDADIQRHKLVAQLLAVKPRSQMRFAQALNSSSLSGEQLAEWQGAPLAQLQELVDLLGA